MDRSNINNILFILIIVLIFSNLVLIILSNTINYNNGNNNIITLSELNQTCINKYNSKLIIYTSDNNTKTYYCVNNKSIKKIPNIYKVIN